MTSDKDQIKLEVGLLLEVINKSPTIKVDDSSWNICKLEVVNYVKSGGGFPLTIKLSCNNWIRLNTEEEFMSLPIKDIPCKCGNSSHWFVKFSEVDY